MKSKKIKLPLAVSISISLALLLIITGSFIGWFNYSGTRRILLTTTLEIIQRSGKNTISELQRIYDPVEGFVKILVNHPITKAGTTKERLEYINFLEAGLSNNLGMSATYIGYSDGSFFLMRVLEKNYKTNFEIPEGSKYLVQSVEVTPKEKINLFIFYDKDLHQISSFTPENYEYDPRTRDWYVSAIEKESTIRTDPYVFFTTREVGKTFAMRTESKSAVIGADVTLVKISNSLESQKISKSTEIILIDKDLNGLAYLNSQKLILPSDDGKVKLAHLNELRIPVLNKISQDFLINRDKTGYSVEVNEETWLVYSSVIPVSGEEPNTLIIASPEDELLEEAKDSLNNTLLITLILIILTLPIIWIVVNMISRSMKKLIHFTTAIQNLDFSGKPPGGSRVKELDDLSITVTQMKGTIQKFLEISSILTGEKDFSKLMQHILSETVESANAEAGVLYLVSNDENSLEPSAVFLKDGNTITIKEDSPKVSLNEFSYSFPILNIIKENKSAIIQVDQSAFENELNFFGIDRQLDFPFMIGVPLKNQESELIGFLCIFEEQDISNNSAIISFVEALSGTSSVAIENQRLIMAQKKLFEAFIKLIASAIDTKSPYTGGHCTRVPEIAKDLASALVLQENGPFASFKMSNNEKEALHIGAWLHDCGKIVTPENVVDKATKLEMIYDRIHEIRMRFEVIKRDKIIEYYKKLVDGGDKKLLDKELEEELKLIDEEYIFIANCNVGGEFMAVEKIERVKKIADRTWQRTLDDTIGISQEESLRITNKSKQIPFTENLLSDKPEHIIPRKDSDKIEPNNPWNFKVKVPKNKFNHGEIYNLCIERGTLSEEERFIINAHMIQTIKMLEELPFPKHLRSVPEIAGGHHEKMDGTGYPRRLKKENMSIQARIMAIADIFEALTAIDRPYKKGKTLSESIKIMDKMRKEQHIDSDLFDIFLTSGVYMQYAQKYMKPYQIDELDVKQYVATI
jgi:HD-GYP domain-containing protein (c-di-GMP phosphodiesterase class II)